MGNIEIAYLCNGEQCKDKEYPYCALRGLGECSHTLNPKFAKNRFCGDPWNYPERFECYKVGDEERYFEKED